jgi:F0F1-type ATP synthase delta subunit
MNINFVSVKTPYHLTDIEKKLIEELIGGSVYLRIDIDPSVIGGLKLLTNNGKLYDLSIEGNLKKMREKIVYG